MTTMQRVVVVTGAAGALGQAVAAAFAAAGDRLVLIDVRRDALSAAFGCAVVLLNLAISAFILSTAARVGPEVLFGAVMLGFFVRMGIVALAVLAVRHQSWVVIMPLGLALVITHLGLFAWEARYMSSSLAAPGLKPTKKVKS